VTTVFSAPNALVTALQRGFKCDLGSHRNCGLMR